MLKHFIPLIYTGIFGAILVTTVPKKEIRYLAIYGIIFGAILDVLAIIFGRITGLYGYINYGPLGMMGLHFFAPISWTLFYMLYFYFLPKRKPLMYVYVASAIFYSIFFANLIVNLGIFNLTHRLLDPLIAFSIWIPTATWGFLWLTKAQQQESRIPMRFKLSPQPARKIEKEDRKVKLINPKKL